MQRSSPYAWLSTYLFGFFFTYGIYLPFWGLWFESQHISAGDIGILMGLGLGARCVTNLVLTPRFSKMEKLIPALRWMSLGSVITLGSYFFSGSDFWLMATSTILFNVFFSPLTPLADALANYYSKLGHLDYGKTRLWGSIAFVVGSTAVGYLVAGFGSDMILIAAFIAMIVAYLIALRTPAVMPTSKTEVHQTNVKVFSLLKQPDVLRFMTLIALIQGSHAAYYAFSTIYWKSSGISEEIIGYLWSLGVIAEIVVFAKSRRWFASRSVQSLFMLASLGVVVRWGLTASTTHLVALVVIQLLHGVTFATAHITAVRYIQGAPESQMVPLQAIYNAVPMGAVLAIMTAISGWGYERFGAQVFWLMAAMGVVALFIRLDPKSTPVTQNVN